jgi:hypothetical protein
MTKGITKFTSIHSGDELIDGALRMAVALAGAAVGGADGVSVSLRRRGVLTTVAATDGTISSMDANQYETGEGPCVDASTEGHWFHAESLERETRWPAFTPRARALGIQAILSSPLLVEEHPVGALNIYSLTPSGLVAAQRCRGELERRRPVDPVPGSAADARGDRAGPGHLDGAGRPLRE